MPYITDAAADRCRRAGWTLTVESVALSCGGHLTGVPDGFPGAGSSYAVDATPAQLQSLGLVEADDWRWDLPYHAPERRLSVRRSGDGFRAAAAKCSGHERQDRLRAAAQQDTLVADMLASALAGD